MPRTPGSKNVAKKPRLHPLISALISELPAAGSKWDSASRLKWLRAIEGMFDYAYGANEPAPFISGFTFHPDAVADIKNATPPSNGNGAKPSHTRTAIDQMESFLKSTDRYVIDPDGYIMHGSSAIDPHEIPPGSVIHDYRRNPDDDYNPIMWKSHGSKKLPLPPGVQLRTATEPWTSSTESP